MVSEVISSTISLLTSLLLQILLATNTEKGVVGGPFSKLASATLQLARQACSRCDSNCSDSDLCTVPRELNYGANAQDTLGGVLLFVLRVVRERQPDQDD